MTGIEYEDLQRLLANPGEATGHRGDGSVGGIPVPTAADLEAKQDADPALDELSGATVEAWGKSWLAISEAAAARAALGLGTAATMSPAEVVTDPDAQAALSATFAQHAESITVPARVWSAVFGLPSLEALGNTVPAWMLRDGASDYIGMSFERGADDGFAIPDSWSAYDVQVQVAAASGSGDAVLVWQHRAEADNPGSSMTSAEAVTASLTTTLQWVTLAEGVPVPTGGAALRARIYRHGQNAADTLSGYAGITKVRLTANPS